MEGRGLERGGRVGVRGVNRCNLHLRGECIFVKLICTSRFVHACGDVFGCLRFFLAFFIAFAIPELFLVSVFYARAQ